MTKGKKFNAAERHFHEKEIKLKRIMQELESSTKKANKIANELQKENEKLKAENDELKAQNQKLMELHQLNEEDIQAILKQAYFKQKLNSLINVYQQLT